MGTPYIKSLTGTLRNRKVISLAGALRIPRAHALGHLHALWYAVMEQQDDGDLTSWTDVMIAESADRPMKSATQFVSMLQSTGLLGYRDPESKTMIPGTERLIHDWIDYAGEYLMGRYAKNHRDRLVEIWRKHMREYGKRCPSEVQVESNLSPPLTNKLEQTSYPPNGGGGRGGGKREAEMREIARSIGGKS